MQRVRTDIPLFSAVPDRVGGLLPVIPNPAAPSLGLAALGLPRDAIVNAHLPQHASALMYDGTDYQAQFLSVCHIVSVCHIMHQTRFLGED